MVLIFTVKDNRSTLSRNPGIYATGGSGSGGHSNPSRAGLAEVNEHLALAVIRLQQSMDLVVNRLESIENRIERRVSLNLDWIINNFN